jgi:hypothetical protein
MEEAPQVILTREHVEALVREQRVTPRTRRLLVGILGFVAVVCVLAQVVMILIGKPGSEGVMNIAATAIGALAGMAVPSAR